MKINIISYTLFLFMMVLFFPSLIFAPWSVHNPPKVPTDGIARTCPEWIEFNGFTLDNYKENRKMAKRRDAKLDKQATTWAAVYAFTITGGIDRTDILPKDFCDSFGDENLQPKQFLALENERRTCDRWITLYRFSDDYHNNFSIAVTQKQKRLPAISIWAHIYYLYIIKFRMTNNYLFEPMTPIAFCTKIGKSVGDDEEKRMSFMCDNDTMLTCHEWIRLYEYTDNPAENYNKAFNNESDGSQDFFLLIHYFPFNYAKKLLQEGLSVDTINFMTPQEYCKGYNGEGDKPTSYDLFYLGPWIRETVF